MFFGVLCRTRQAPKTEPVELLRFVAELQQSLKPHKPEPKARTNRGTIRHGNELSSLSCLMKMMTMMNSADYSTVVLVLVLVLVLMLMLLLLLLVLVLVLLVLLVVAVVVVVVVAVVGVAAAVVAAVAVAVAVAGGWRWRRRLR